MFQRLFSYFAGITFISLILFGVPAFATSAGSLIIAQVQAGSVSGDGAATQEYISVYNNTDTSVDITNWCLTNKSNASFACFTPPASNVTLTLGARSYALVASDSFASYFNVSADIVFPTTNKTSGSLTAGSDTVSLLDANGTVVDSVNWAASLSGGSVLQRQWSDSKTMKDTDVSGDFTKSTAFTIPASGVSEEEHIVDECPNIDGAQATVPDGDGIADTGDCVHDACPNVSGLQAVLPDGMQYDEALNCLLIMPHLDVSELFPNPSGSDVGNEFIEIYNPNAREISLANYRLFVGPNYEKEYTIMDGMVIGGGQYASFSNASLGFSLLNTSSRVKLASIDGQTIDETPAYVNPPDDESWALIDDFWQFTNQPTPGLANLLPVESTDVVVTSSLKPCAEGQYRSPDTNRCRAIVTSSTSLAPCKDGQYRSEETNRCRSIATDATSTKPCADDQFRNPATGRCKQIASTDDLAACSAGKERNPDTNRCRLVAATTGNPTSGGVHLAPTPAASVLGWWAAGIVGFVGLGYAALEWRREIIALVSRSWSRVLKKA